jgi:hypothetical protein
MLFGGSHVRSLRMASLHEDSKQLSIDISIPLFGGNTFPGGLVMTTWQEKKIVTPVISVEIEKHKVSSDGRLLWLVSSVFGNHANSVGLIKSSNPFDFYHPAVPEDAFSEEVTYLSYDIVKESMYELIEPLSDMFQRLNREGIKGIIHVEGPPPVNDESHIKASLTDVQKANALKMMEEGEKEASDNQPFTINSFAFRKKLWLLQTEITKEICEVNNIIYLYPPPSVFDDTGGLVRGAWRDSVHANTWYGLRVLEQIEATISEIGE